MLKRLLNELRKGASSDQGQAKTDPLNSWQASYSGASPEGRGALFDQLNVWIAANPERVEGWTLRGDWQFSRGALEAAEQDFRRALKLNPQWPRAQEGIGLVLTKAGRLEDAYLHLETAHRLQPMNSDVLVHWGLVSLEMGNLPEARNKFERAVERDVRNVHAWHNLGMVEMLQGNVASGIDKFKRCLELRPEHGGFWTNLALAYRNSERLDDALLAARRAAELRPDSARVWVVLGDVLTDAGLFGEARDCLDKAIAQEPALPSGHMAMGKLCLAWGHHRECAAAFQAALALAPHDPEAELGLAQLRLLQGNFDEGWALYESRKRTDPGPVRSLPPPEWDGSPLQGKTILVQSEQGLGDNIMFASCLPDLAAVAGHVVIEARPELAALFTRSFPGTTVISHDPDDLGFDWLASAPAIDARVAIGSLPMRFRRQSTDFPSRTAYLTADDHLQASLEQRLAALGPRPKIGIAWRGGLVRTGSCQRTLELRDLLLALRDLPVQLISLQYGDVSAEVRAASTAASIHVHHWPEVVADQAHAAALTRALDFVITACQTQAHLTGALGCPGYVLAPANPSWRYGASGTSIPWYPSLRIVRQPEIGSWSSALVEVVDLLAARLGLSAETRS